MSATSHIAGRRPNARNNFPVLLGLGAVIFFFLASGFVSYWNTRVFSRDATLVTHTHEIITALSDLISLVKDAETGQRGFVITGDEHYLAPYNAAVNGLDIRLADVERMIADEPDQLAHLPQVKAHIHGKMSELAETVNLRRTQGFDAAYKVVITDRGKAEMDALRNVITTMQDSEIELRNHRFAEMNGAYRVAVASGVLTSLLGVFITCVVAALMRRASNLRRHQDWLQAGQVGLSSAVFGEQRLEKLGESILTFLAEYFGAHAAAFFVRDGENFRRVATYGIADDGQTPKRFHMGEGLLGQAAKDRKNFLLRDIPEGYIAVSSALGQGMPRQLLIAPATTEDAVNAVLELGFIHPIADRQVELFARVSESIAIAVRSANYRANLQNLLEETQRQAEELQAQSEELRVSNEELEEQSRALKESQSHLEQQQAEMEQTNAQLEEQAQLLENQRDDIGRAKAAVQLKAHELEQASKYKSDFLANMSHELRTPLNSSLILAKLLADNSQGNLTAEQVKFAQTIQSSGNDLLSLINDILDLSKIEAGHMEIQLEALRLERLASDLTPIFTPLAGQKNLAFEIRIAPGLPESIETDRQRLEQVLKNLLSNAVKFTETGKVELLIARAADRRISFTVSDSGIGIPEEQQQAIFDAFRQADGTISRKYGGTGLGLSISRELTRLLGGLITLKSEVGKGSHFTITLPETYDAATIAPRPAPALSGPSVFDTAPIPEQKKPAAVPTRRSDILDDRNALTGTSRVILVVEDDISFARILFDLAHELDFQCLVATTAEEALAVALQYLPHAVVLDVGLPDHSGLSVLDRLKRDARTRHIPVHVVSGGDYAQTALSLGAVGYMLKPVKRTQLIDALKGLETRLDQRMRRVLIVEDDDVQRDSMRHLLGSHDVDTIAVGTATDCLTLLKNSTFDCMVLDLSLPDASGYQLLETLSREDAYSFPPVIVYTGRDLSNDEEQTLRQYSKSIIIKGAKSPERLLDEVTLFLHQVVADLPAEQQRMIEQARNRDAVLEGHTILVVEDDVRNVYAITSIFEPLGAHVRIARNGREALELLDKNQHGERNEIDLVLMDVMMPEMDGLTATREIRKRAEWKKLPIIMLTAKAMKDDQERCLDAGANDYMAKPLDVEKLLSLVRVWMPR